MKYKVGDRVKIREDLSVSDAGTVARMLMWSGKVMTVRRVGDDYYKMCEDFTELEGKGYFWKDHMIECKVEDEVTQDEMEKFWGVNLKNVSPEEADELLKKTYDFGNVMDAGHKSCDAVEPDAQLDNMVNSPKHYMIGKYELIDFLDELAVHGGYSAVEWGYVLSILQYVCRAPKKNGLQDYQKAKWYLTRLVEMLEAKEKNG